MWNFLSSVGDSVSSGARAVTNTLGITKPPVRKILFVGIDNVGKTTLIYQLVGAQKFQATMSFAVQDHQTTIEGCELKILDFDLGGYHMHRRLYQYYFVDADAVFFFVDASDKTRFPEAKQELDRLLLAKDVDVLNKNIPIVILGNKIDLPGAVSEKELKSALGLEDIDSYNRSKPKEEKKEENEIQQQEKKEEEKKQEDAPPLLLLTGKHHAPRDITQRPCEVFMMSGLKKVGYEDAFQWLFAAWGISKKGFPEPRPGCWEYRKRVLHCALRGKSRLSRAMHEEYVVLRLTTKFC